MKIAISTDQGWVSAHFGRCPSFTIIDIQDGKITAKEEVANPGHLPGAIPKFLHEKGVGCIIAGGMGGRAQGFFQEFGIQTVVGVQGRIDDVIRDVLAGTLQGGESLCKPGDGKGYGIDKSECDHPHQDDCDHERM